MATVADTSTPADQLPAALAAVVKGELPPQQVVDKARTVLAELLVDYLGQFQDYIGQTGEMAVTSVLAVADATVTGGDQGILGKREIAEKVSRRCNCPSVCSPQSCCDDLSYLPSVLLCPVDDVGTTYGNVTRGTFAMKSYHTRYIHHSTSVPLVRSLQ